jgi:hypothetical protein
MTKNHWTTGLAMINLQLGGISGLLFLTSIHSLFQYQLASTVNLSQGDE